MSEQDIQAFLLRVKAVIDEGDFDKADALLNEDGLSRHQHPYTFLYKCIIDRHFERDARDVLAAAEQGLRLSPSFADLIDFKFVSLLALGDHAQAAEAGLMLCSSQPYNYEAHFETAIALEKAGWSDEALRTRARGHYALAQAELARGKKESALAHFTQVLAADPSHNRAKIKRAQLMVGLGLKQEAAAGLVEYAKDPDLAVDALTILCQLAEAENDVGRVTRFSDEILTIDEAHSYALRVKVKLARTAGNNTAVDDALIHALRQHDDDVWCNLLQFSIARDANNAS